MEERKVIEGQTWRDVFQKYKPDITDDEINYILWNETCFPFDNEITLKQIESFLNGSPIKPQP